MNPLSYYDRQKDSLDQTETDNLLREYTLEHKTVSEIADIHRRTPGACAYKLVSLKIIRNTQEANGYSDYKKSQLYNEIVQSSKSIKKERIPKETTAKSERIPRITRTLLSEQLTAIQQKLNKLESLSEYITCEIRELKMTMVELNKVYPKPKKLLVSSTSVYIPYSSNE